MKKIKVRNTYNIAISGRPSESVSSQGHVERVAVLPSSISSIKPKLLVKKGDLVKIGSPLFRDKQNESLVFLSPGGGRVEDVVYGEKRSLDQVIISLDADEQLESFPVFSYDQVRLFKREELVRAIVLGGLWPIFRSYPFLSIPSPDVEPPAIYVTIDNDEPFLPNAQVYLNDRIEDLKFALMVLRRLSKSVYVGVSEKSGELKRLLQDDVTHELEGDYPANDPGVFLYYNKQSQDENVSWGVKGQDLLRLASLLKEGRYPTERVVTLGGALVKSPRHILAREGVSIRDLLGESVSSEPARYIAGGVLRGRRTSLNSFLGYQDFGLNVIREGKELEMLSFFRPGFDKPTSGRTYLSALLKGVDFDMTSSLNGGDRACISCAKCPSVCPVDLLPQVVMKSLYVGDIEEAISLGFLDCVQCGLCTYVCPSKINLDQIFADGKETIKKEAS